MSTAGSTAEFESLLEYLRQTRAFDFSGYKRASLMRRISKRMQTVHMESYAQYQDYLEVHPEEFALLFNTILINVTAFFRDAPSWEYLAGEVIPRILARKKPYEPIRVWSAACASGEEAYSMAILFAEALGLEAVRDRVKIYATDVDEEALNTARHGAYTARDVSAVSPELLDKYFERVAGRFVLHRELRRCVIFGRHDLLQDAPISRIDLLVCRNALMYFNAETQGRVMARFHFALNDTGYLFLGKAEMLLTQNSLFLPVDLKCRIFAKVAKSGVRDRLLTLAQAGVGEALSPIADHVRLREAALDATPAALIATDLRGTLALANERARLLFNLSPRDIGRPVQDLDLSYRPVELRSVIDQATSEHRTVRLKEVEWTSGDGTKLFLDIDVVPLSDPGSAANDPLLGVAIICIDVTRAHQLQVDLRQVNQELETAYEELQSTNEELETTNEELQSTVEELETTNEELHSTNEELETMNEELQSTNEELKTVNGEVRQRSRELNRTNAYLESILSSLQGAVIVTDHDLRVQVWSPKAHELWGLRAAEVSGEHLLNLDIGLPADQLRQPIRACLAGDLDHYEETLTATNRRGRSIECRIACNPLFGSEREIEGIILLIEESGV